MSETVAQSYIIEYNEQDQSYLRRVINPLRGPTDSIPDLRPQLSLRAGDAMFERFGLEDYVGCVTAEMPSRPIPHAFRVKETEALTALYKEWAPHIFKRVFMEMEPPTQTYNKVSRLGWPEFVNPENKREVLEAYFAQIANDELKGFENAFTIVNVRLQAESKKKKRKYLFLDSQGHVYEQETSAASRTVDVKGVGPRVSSRTRLIFNLPIPNLYKQVLDTAIHNVFLKYPAFHHDMFNKKLLPVRGTHFCLDVKHFERYTANSVRHRATDVIGGLYGRIGHHFASIPFALPDDKFDHFYYAYPNRQGGWSDQFASGDSAVAPVQKEIFTALYGEYFRRTRGISYESAISLVFAGGDAGLSFRNYGDDNSLSGDPREIEQVFALLATYLAVEEEKPPKFLGFEWVDNDWFLPVSSYLLKTYLNERRPYSNFRRYPNLGWKLKRDIFTKLGVPEIAEHVFPVEDRTLRAFGLNWLDVLRRADNELRQSLATPGQRDNNWVMGKDYAMTSDEKLATGEFIGLQPSQTAKIIKHLLPVTWHKCLRW